MSVVWFTVAETQGPLDFKEWLFINFTKFKLSKSFFFGFLSNFSKKFLKPGKKQQHCRIMEHRHAFILCLVLLIAETTTEQRQAFCENLLYVPTRWPGTFLQILKRRSTKVGFDYQKIYKGPCFLLEIIWKNSLENYFHFLKKYLRNIYIKNYYEKL